MHFDPKTHCSQKQPLLLQGSQISPASCLIFWGYFHKTSSSYLFVKETDHKVCQKGVFKTTNLGNLEDHSNLLLQHWACGGRGALPFPHQSLLFPSCIPCLLTSDANGWNHGCSIIDDTMPIHKQGGNEHSVLRCLLSAITMPSQSDSIGTLPKSPTPRFTLEYF